MQVCQISISFSGFTPVQNKASIDSFSPISRISTVANKMNFLALSSLQSRSLFSRREICVCNRDLFTAMLVLLVLSKIESGRPREMELPMADEVIESQDEEPVMQAIEETRVEEPVASVPPHEEQPRFYQPVYAPAPQYFYPTYVQQYFPYFPHPVVMQQPEPVVTPPAPRPPVVRNEERIVEESIAEAEEGERQIMDPNSDYSTRVDGVNRVRHAIARAKNVDGGDYVKEVIQRHQESLKTEEEKKAFNQKVEDLDAGLFTEVTEMTVKRAIQSSEAVTAENTPNFLHVHADKLEDLRKKQNDYNAQPSEELAKEIKNGIGQIATALHRETDCIASIQHAVTS